jgi:hypothetical protein
MDAPFLGSGDPGFWKSKYDEDNCQNDVRRNGSERSEFLCFYTYCSNNSNILLLVIA